MQMSQTHICTHEDDRIPAEVSHIDGSKLWGLVGQGVWILSLGQSQWEI